MVQPFQTELGAAPPIPVLPTHSSSVPVRVAMPQESGSTRFNLERPLNLRIPPTSQLALPLWSHGLALQRSKPGTAAPRIPFSLAYFVGKAP